MTITTATPRLNSFGLSLHLPVGITVFAAALIASPANATPQQPLAIKNAVSLSGVPASDNSRTICSPMGASSGVRNPPMLGVGFLPELDERLRFRPVQGTPFCELNYSDDTRTHRCTCLDGSVHQGKRDISTLVGGSNFELRIPQCQELLVEFCGTRPEGTNVECESPSSQGDCSFWSSSFNGSDGANRVGQSCDCADGRSWSTEQFSKQGLPISEDQAQEACQAQARLCESGDKLEPTSQDIVLPGDPKTNEYLDTASCYANFDPSLNEMESHCELFVASEDLILFKCGCGAQELPLAGFVPRTLPSRAGLVAQCSHILKQCDPKSQIPGTQPTSKPRPDGCEDAVKDAMKVSCAVASGGRSPWYGLLGMLGLLFVRKKRRA